MAVNYLELFLTSSTIVWNPFMFLPISQSVHQVLLVIQVIDYGIGKGDSIQVPPTIINLIYGFSIFFSEVIIFKNIKKEKINLSFYNKLLQSDS